MIHRTSKKRGFTHVYNCLLKDASLSLQAKGLLAILLLFPNDWVFHIDHIVRMSSNGKTATISALRELERAGYLIRVKTRNARGQFEHRFEVYDTPHNDELPSNSEPSDPASETPEVISPAADDPSTENPLADEPSTASMAPTNTDATKNVSTNTDGTYTEREQSHTLTRITPPSLEEVVAYCAERRNGIDPQRYIAYNEARGWAGIMDWRAHVRSWERIDSHQTSEAAGEQHETTSFDIDEFFRAAVEKSYSDELPETLSD